MQKMTIQDFKNNPSYTQYKRGLISLGKMAEYLSISKPEATRLVDRLGIDWLDYAPEELEEQVTSARAYRRD